MSSIKNLTYGFDKLVFKVDQNLLNPKYCLKAYNCTFSGGVLKSEFSINEAKNFRPDCIYGRQKFGKIEEDAIRRILLYRRNNNGLYDDRIIAILYNGSVYSTKLFEKTEWTKIENIKIKGHITYANYKYNGDDVLLISSETNNLVVLNDMNAKIIASGPKFESITIHNERVYGALNETENQIWFSDDFDPTNWNINNEEAGFINFADECGKVIKVISFSNYLFIFRERGIYRLTAFSNQSEFLLKKLFVNTGKIYAKTIAECGDSIIFFCDEGLMKFNGYDVVKLNFDLPEIYTKEKLIGSYYNGSYYIACGIVEPIIENTFINNALIKCNLEKMQVEMFAPLDVADLLSVSSHHASMLYLNLRDIKRDKEIAEVGQFVSGYLMKN